MSWWLDRVRDQYVGHDYPGVCGSTMGTYVLDELELGARAALEIQDPEQAWWELELNLKAREDRSYSPLVKWVRGRG